MRTIQCPECQDTVTLRDVHAHVPFALGALCDCGWLGYGHLDGDQFVFEDEIPSPRRTRAQVEQGDRT